MGLEDEDMDAPFGQCACGTAWFELAVPDDAEPGGDVGPAVCIDILGNITGYAGKLVCLECGTSFNPLIQPWLAWRSQHPACAPRSEPSEQ